ncbi:MAG TPA: four-helix bundle copper-binding protein [Pirellulales bacterium]
MSHERFASCIEACVRCAQECEHCASACLDEHEVGMLAECIRLDRDCAEVCLSALAMMSRGSRFATEVCRVCAEICDACGEECAKHDHEHCQRCAEACRHCADECRQMAGVAA